MMSSTVTFLSPHQEQLELFEEYQEEYRYPEKVDELMSYFPGSFINEEKELVLIPKKNLFFQLKDVEDDSDLVYKLLSWFSYDCWKNSRSLMKINQFLDTNFTRTDIELIYTKLGNGVNRELAYLFIDSCFDLDLLKGGRK